MLGELCSRIKYSRGWRYMAAMQPTEMLRLDRHSGGGHDGRRQGCPINHLQQIAAQAIWIFSLTMSDSRACCINLASNTDTQPLSNDAQERLAKAARLAAQAVA